MNILRLTAILLIAMMLVPIDGAAHCKGKHTGDHEHCTGGDDPPDPGSGSADPQLVYRDRDNLPASFLANSDGRNQTQIWDAGVIGSLDAPGNRVLFRGVGLDMLTYENVGGEIVNVIHTVLFNESQTS